LYLWPLPHRQGSFRPGVDISAYLSIAYCALQHNSDLWLTLKTAVLARSHDLSSLTEHGVSIDAAIASELVAESRSWATRLTTPA